MKKYYEQATLIEYLNKNVATLEDGFTTMDCVTLAILHTPTADVVEVVRCEKCKDFEPHGNGKAGICRNRNHKPCLRHNIDFCSYGERK